MDTESIAALVAGLRVLPWWGGLFLCSLLVTWRFFSWYDRKQDRVHKDTRAGKYAQAMVALTEAIRNHEFKEASRISQVQSGLAETQVRLQQFCITLEEVARRTRGALSPASTIRLIQLYYGHIAAAVKQIVTREMVEGGSSPMLSRKVRTHMAVMVAQVREYVRQASRSLSVPPDAFFPTYIETPPTSVRGSRQSDSTPLPEGQGGERFFLVDLLWEAVFPLFAQSTNLRDRMETAELVIDNTVTDYFSGLVNAYRISHPESFGDHDQTKDSTGPYPTKNL